MEKTMFSVAIVAALSLWGSWASAESASAYSDDFDADDSAFVAEVDAENDRPWTVSSEYWEAAYDVDAFNVAERDRVAAPAFCAVVLVQRDETHGWRAVCELVSEDGAL